MFYSTRPSSYAPSDEGLGLLGLLLLAGTRAECMATDLIQTIRLIT